MAGQLATTRLRRGARRFRWIAYFAAALAMICVGAELLLALSPLWRGGDKANVLSSVLAQVMMAAPAVSLIVGLHWARRLFRRIEEGELFTQDNSRDFARIGWWVVGGAAWSLTIGGMAPAQTGVTAQQLAGIGAGAKDLALLALGFALVVVGQVVAEARLLKAENDSIL